MNKKDESFFELVYQVVKLIPEGRITTYGTIAKYLGMARSARMVGWAMNNSHKLQTRIPAHRVVNRNGVLTGKFHFDSLLSMQELLEKEGIKIENDKILNFNNYFWDPFKELKIE